MIAAALLCAFGFAAGFLLIRRVPLCPSTRSYHEIYFSIIIPARNEERNLPRLLASIAASATRPVEVLVVDDASTDNTASVAQSLGASVLRSAHPPLGWTGKSWACHQGADRAMGDVLLFLDADTYFIPGGLDRVIAFWGCQKDRRLVVSLLPYHAMISMYEQLSLVFNLLMAAGAGGFGGIAAPKLFGQSLLIAKEMYRAAGGHAAVPGVVLENLRLADILHNSDARILCLGGRDTLHMRMFPEGFRQMSESWTKTLMQGAADSGPVVLTCAIIWIAAQWSTVLLLIFQGDNGRLAIAVVYVLIGLQLAWNGRKLGSYSLSTCLLYPLPLGYYCLVFGQSAVRRALHRKSTWRGREV
ncbi:MAG: glycosyltransferase family 2 protein [Acidobacteriaceae bacterium]